MKRTPQTQSNGTQIVISYFCPERIIESAIKKTNAIYL
jgi:hypothetical protein